MALFGGCICGFVQLLHRRGVQLLAGSFRPFFVLEVKRGLADDLFLGLR